MLLRQPQNSGGAISNALGGMNIDFETFAILLALAGLAGAYALYQVTRPGVDFIKIKTAHTTILCSMPYFWAYLVLHPAFKLYAIHSNLVIIRN